MSLGNKIYELRSSRKLSQEQMAEMLKVSRQSVSKWETDAAVPDIDKLCRLCDIFDVTLDELIGRKQKDEVQSNTATTVKDLPSAHQKTIGYILVAVSLIAGILVGLIADSEEQIVILVPIILCAFICSLICLTLKHNAGYWCIWAAAAPVVSVSPYMVGIANLNLANLFCILFIAVMAFVASKVIDNYSVSPTKKNKVSIASGWAVILSIRVIFYLLPNPPWFLYNIIALFSYIATAFLLTRTVCYIKTLRRQK